MAEALAIDGPREDSEIPDKGLKCRKCRSGYLVQIQDKDSSDFRSTHDLFLFEEDALPGWILQKIEEVVSTLERTGTEHSYF